MYINNQQLLNSNGLYAHKSYISNNFEGAISDSKGVLHCEGYDYEEFPDENLDAPLSQPFFKKGKKMLSRPDGFMLYGELGVDFFSTSEMLYPNMKNRLRLIRSNFHMISDNPNVSLGIVDCPLHTRRIALKDDYHMKKMDMLANTPVDYNFLETLAKPFIILSDKTTSFKKTFSTLLQFVGSLLQRIQTLHSLDLTLKTGSGINNLISDKLEYSEEVSQL